VGHALLIFWVVVVVVVGVLVGERGDHNDSNKTADNFSTHANDKSDDEDMLLFSMTYFSLHPAT